jgi:transmembrane sensor
MAVALRAPSDDRRRALRAAFGLLVLGVGAWGARSGYQQLGLDAAWRSVVGQRGNTRLADGTAMAYDADSRIYLSGSAAAPVLHLQQGQLLLAADAGSARAITVVTDHGAVQAGSAAFNVGRLHDRSVVSVRSGTVIVRPAGQSRLVLDAGQTCYFSRDGARASELSFAAVSGWTRGVHVADRVPLAELLEVFGRYRAGILRATGPAASRLVSGVFRLHDIDQALLQLADAFPVTIRRYGRYLAVLS